MAMETEATVQGSWDFLPSLCSQSGRRERGRRQTQGTEKGRRRGRKAGRTTPKMCEIYCMLNCWLCGGQYCKNVSTSTRSSFCSSSPKCSTWFCKSSTDTRQPSVSPVPSLSTRHMIRAASLGKEGRRALGRLRPTHHPFVHLLTHSASTSAERTPDTVSGAHFYQDASYTV